MSEQSRLSTAPARKALGQHFLFDPSILSRTALSAGPVEGKTIVEVGPGPGGLTQALLQHGADRVICVESDERFAAELSTWRECETGRLEIIQGDARKQNWADLVGHSSGDEPVNIVANLPYNVGTPLLIDWLKAGDWRGSMALMFQKEVAQRVCAKPGDGHYGRLAVLVGAVCSAQIAFSLPPGAFKPPPKVDSAVAVLHPLKPEQKFNNLTNLEAVSTAAFGQRRKMLRVSLKSLAKKRGINALEWLSDCMIDPTARPETLDQFSFRRLASYIGERDHAA